MDNRNYKLIEYREGDLVLVLLPQVTSGDTRRLIEESLRDAMKSGGPLVMNKDYAPEFIVIRKIEEDANG